VLISAYDGDPLQAHIDRLGAMPEGWSAQKVATPQAHQDLSLGFLLQHAGPAVSEFLEDQDKGFVHIQTAQFDGLIHWRGRGSEMRVAGPGSSIDLIEGETFCIDPPGHGLSDGWNGEAPTDRAAWDAVFEAARDALGAGFVRAAPAEDGDPASLFADLSPDRHGAYLTTAWNIARARHFFRPWYEADAAHAQSFDPASISPERLALEHRALLKATAARAFQTALSQPK
jgi:haloalkane dehalogenase